MYPLVPPLLSFIAGILSSGVLPPSRGVLFAALAASFVLLAFLAFRGVRFRGWLAAPPFFVLGALFIIPYQNPVPAPGHLVDLLKDPEAAIHSGETEVNTVLDLTGLVATSPEFDGEVTKFVFDAMQVNSEEGAVPTGGLVRMTVAGRGGEILVGDTVRLIARVREPANFGNPGEFDYRRRLLVRGIFLTGFVKDGRFIVKVEDGPSGPRRSIEKARLALDGFIDSSGLRYPGVMKALLVGERAGVDPATKEAFVETGTAHILAISGLHVGIVGLFAYALCLWLLKRSTRLMLAIDVRRTALLATLPPIVFYALLSGMQLSTRRSVVMAGALVLSVLAGRGRSYYNILALAALGILLLEPYAIREASFQLTFSAVFMIIFLGPRIRRLLDLEDRKDGDGGRPGALHGCLRDHLLRRRIVPLVAISLAAAVGTAPVLAYHFNIASPAGLPANLVAVPGAGVVVPLLLSSAAVYPLTGWGASLLLHAADIVFAAIAFAIGLISRLPYSSVRVPTPALLEVALFYVSVFALVRFRRGGGYRVLLAAALAALIVLQVYYPWRVSSSSELRATFISVGQGDSALIEFPGGGTMLIDGGGLYNPRFDTGERIIAPLLWKKRIRKIDWMVMTHAQRDHMAGLEFIGKKFEVGEFWWNGLGEAGTLAGLMRSGGARVVETGAGGGLTSAGGVTVEILHPAPEDGLDVNGSSLVVRLVYGERALLFTGDIGAEAEARIIERVKGDGLKADVLKAPHHGSRTSSSPEFLAGVRPEVVVISAGRLNPFGFPHPESLDAYEEIGARVLRTDIDGAVEVSTDGAALSVRTYGGRR